MAEREPGYYWIRRLTGPGVSPGEEWVIAEWRHNWRAAAAARRRSSGQPPPPPHAWLLIGNPIAFDDQHFAEIGEAVERRGERAALYLTDNQIRSLHYALELAHDVIRKSAPEAKPSS